MLELQMHVFTKQFFFKLQYIRFSLIKYMACLFSYSVHLYSHVNFFSELYPGVTQVDSSHKLTQTTSYLVQWNLEIREYPNIREF